MSIKHIDLKIISNYAANGDWISTHDVDMSSFDISIWTSD